MKATIPLSPADLGGRSVTVGEGAFEVLGGKGRVCIAEFCELPDAVEWFEEFEPMYCQLEPDGETIKVIRPATDQDFQRYRVPLWIQAEEVPECCGQPMFFVGQLDDDVLCAEPPEDAEMWWHDAASFYVFTCPKCLSVKAVGQQY